jgi:hypothetical protein
VRFNKLNERPFTTEEYYNDLVAKNCARNGHFKHRNKLILDLLSIVGLRPRELCLLSPNHFMSTKGEFSEFLLIESHWSFNGNERPSVLSHDEVQKSFTDYIKWMVKFGVNSIPGTSYLGINPNLPILVDDNYKNFGLQSRGKKTSEVAKLVPQKMNEYIKELIVKSGLSKDNVGLASFHRTWVINAYRNGGMDIKSIAILAGISQETVLNYLAYDPQQYNEIINWFEDKRIKKVKLLESRIKRRKFELNLS